MRIIDRFSSEHDVFISQLEVIEDLTRGGAAVASIVAAIRTRAAPLRAHAEREERPLFPDLRPSMGRRGRPARGDRGLSCRRAAHRRLSSRAGAS